MMETGVAIIKPEFIIPDNEKRLCLASTIEDTSNGSEKCVEDAVCLSEGDPPPYKRQRLTRQEKKKLRGQNKARPIPYKVEREKSLCNSLLNGNAESQDVPICSNEKCTFIHSIDEYLAIKQPDIGSTCYLYSVQGYCPRGITCRFGTHHINSSRQNIKNTLLYEQNQSGGVRTLNSLQKELQHKLRKWKYDFSASENIIKVVDAERKKDKELTGKADSKDKIMNEVKENLSSSDHTKLIEPSTTENASNLENGMDIKNGNLVKEDNGSIVDDKKLGPVPDHDIILLKPKEKVIIDWRDKLYLSPLTTVGNLPFRRVCKEFGVDITCGEMAMANSILQGKPQEWALVKRHVSEDLFGVQLCGGNPYVMTKCAQLVEEQANINFIDVNLGCPIELVYQKGEGSGLLQRDKALSSVVQCMSRVLTIPLTVKSRTGVFTDKNIAHKLVPKFRQWGASLVTVHGRSREQRYTKLADWPYIEKCAELAAPVPLFLNGDILSFEDYERARAECPTVAGCMIGRGALIKPWIFTEIKERRHWDISSSERLEILKKYVNYGLEHWGSDTKGVENTRRFLLEWLSFLYRYIPIGILEKPPQHMNERPPFYRGRDELETLMVSSNCQDWIKISEMLLGPVPEKYNFLPKHKANAWN